jgi:hemerythrin-like metal-binding protein
LAYFDWDSKLTTGIQVIDDQHKKLINLVNELHEAMRNRKAKEIVEHILKELGEYTIYHFSVEEKAFEKYGYAQRNEHRKNHEDLVKQLNDLVQKHKKGELAISIEILDFLTNWVKTHIMKEDMMYVPFLKDKVIME